MATVEFSSGMTCDGMVEGVRFLHPVLLLLSIAFPVSILFSSLFMDRGYRSWLQKYPEIFEVSGQPLAETMNIGSDMQWFHPAQNRS